MRRLGLKTDPKDHLHWVGKKVQVNPGLGQHIERPGDGGGDDKGEVDTPYPLLCTSGHPPCYTTWPAPSILARLAAWSFFFVSEEKQHSLVQTSSSSILEDGGRKRGPVLEGKVGRAKE